MFLLINKVLFWLSVSFFPEACLLLFWSIFLCFWLSIVIGKNVEWGLSGGDLHYHLSQHGVFTEQEMRFYASEVILGLEHMHRRSVVYRDLKVCMRTTRLHGILEPEVVRWFVIMNWACQISGFFSSLTTYSLPIFSWMNTVMSEYLTWA